MPFPNQKEREGETQTVLKHGKAKTTRLFSIWKWHQQYFHAYVENLYKSIVTALLTPFS
jgi:hypothetical protein